MQILFILKLLLILRSTDRITVPSPLVWMLCLYPPLPQIIFCEVLSSNARVFGDQNFRRQLGLGEVMRVVPS